MDGQGFNDLTYRGQVRRLRVLGRHALRRFGLQRGAPLRLLFHGENSTFQTTNRRGQRLVLRIHRTGYQTPHMVRSELQWLQALRRDTDLVVPEPVVGRDGQFVQQVADPGVAGERSCVLFKWVPGRFVRAHRSEAFYNRTGTLAGRLHAHARSWRRPVGFRRRAWREQVLFGEAAGYGDPFVVPGLTRRDFDLYRACIERAREEIAALGKGTRVWGLIHGDMHSGNVTFEGDRANAIDFDDCGAGWYAYEIAVAMASPWDPASFARNLAWFLKTYELETSLDEATVRAVPCFLAVRRLSMVGWIGSRADNPRLASLIPMSIRRARPVIQAYLRGQFDQI